MAYVNPNYKNGKLFREAVGRGVIHRPYNPSGLFPQPQNGTDVIEGPHNPKPHSWYVEVVIENGIVVKAGKVRLGSTKTDSDYGTVPTLTIGAVLDNK